MSSKKDKFLESAQKFIVKGQLDRAIKDYEQVVALDPNDIRHRQRLAELLVRANRTIEAIGEYEAIGKYYGDNGFYLKAIAVYKQIQKLDPDNIKTCLSLASLNEKQGLTVNALAEYGRACSYFEKSGKPADALKVLESMIALDPDNLATRQKCAETRYALGMKENAYEDFTQTALLLSRRGDTAACDRIVDRVRHLYPAKKDFPLELLAAEIESGNASLAVPRLEELTEKESTSLKAWTLLLDAYKATGDAVETRDTLQKMVRIFPDDPEVQERLVLCALDAGDVDGGLALLDRHGRFFEERGDLHLLERLYRGLLDISPQDVRVLKGLIRVYEAAGDRERLAEMADRLDSLERVRPVTAPAASAGSPRADAESALPEESPEGPTVDEGEIPQALAEEYDSGQVGEEADRAPLPAADETVGTEAEADILGEGVADEFDYPMEVDLELDISEDELADLDGLYGENAPDDDLGGGEDDAAEEDAASVDITPDLGVVLAPQDAGRAAAGDFVELTVDALLEPEGSPPEDESGESPGGQGKYSPDGLVSAFTKGLAQQLDQGDTETRYNLGIAFKEMGLYDEAMAEFEAAAADPRRRVDCLTLQGICCRDKGDFARAEAIFRDGVALEGLSEEEFLSITYELALLYESAGRPEDALAALRRIEAKRHDFRETTQKIARLQGGDEMDELELVELEHDDLV